MEQVYKKGILVVSFGTSHLDTMEKTICKIEARMQQHYPDCKLYRAFTSEMILAKLKRENHLYIHNVGQALRLMHEEGIEAAVIQPTHIINGIENDKMLEEVKSNEKLFREVYIGAPLLNSVEDYKASLQAIMKVVKLDENDALVLMGHGTDHHANAAYPAIEYTARSLGYRRVLVGTVEGFPQLSHVVEELKRRSIRSVKLMPFMIVAGDHAKNDMAGDENSWKTILQDAGYQVEVVMVGLGEITDIQNLFVKHLKEALNR